MNALWEQSPRTATEVHEALSPRSDWQLNTVKTLIARLVRKGAVKATTGAKQHSYSPAVARDHCAKHESRSLIGRVYGGALMPMIAGLLEQEKLSKSEITELRRLLDNMERKQRNAK